MTKQAAPIPKADTPKSQQLLKQQSDARSKSMDAIFGGDPVPPTEPNPQPDPQPNPQPKPEDNPAPKPEDNPDPAPKPEEPGVDDIDFDKPPVKPEDPKPEDEPKPEDDPGNRSIQNLRSQLSEVGRRAKDAETKVTEQDLEIKRLKQENEKLKSDLEKPSRVAGNPRSHPQIAKAIDEINEDRDSTALTMDSASRKALGASFESMLQEFASARAEKNEVLREQAIDALRDKIGDQIGDDHIGSVIQLLSRNAGRYADVISKIQNFGDMAAEEMANEEVESWGKSTSQSSAFLKSVLDVSDEIASEDPNNPIVFVSNLIKNGGEQYEQRASLAQQAVIEAFYGKRPLSKSEIDQIKSAEADGGKALDEFLKDRKKAEVRNREGAMRRTLLSMMILPELPGIFKELNELRSLKAKLDQQKQALTNEGGPPKQPAQTPQATPEKASARPSAVSGVLDAMGS